MPKAARRIAHVLPQRAPPFGPIRACRPTLVDLGELGTSRRDVAKLAHRLNARLFTRSTTAHQLFCTRLEVKAKLVVDLRLHVPVVGREAKESANARKSFHRSSLPL